MIYGPDYTPRRRHRKKSPRFALSIDDPYCEVIKIEYLQMGGGPAAD